MNKEILSYAAGLIDGEGTITLVKNASNEKRAPIVSVASTTKELVDYMQRQFGGHVITLRRNMKVGHKQAYDWKVSRDNAIEVIRQVLPYMHEPEKIRRGRLILNQYKIVTPRNGKYTEEMNKLREAFEVEFFKNSTKVKRSR